MSSNPLDQVIFISLPEGTRFGISELDPGKMLPVDIGPTAPQDWDFKDLTWESMESGLLKVLAWDSEREEVPYYRKLLIAVRPAISDELLQMAITKSRDKNFPLAEELFLALKGLFPDKSSSFLNLAVFYESYGRHCSKMEREEEAQEYFSKARDEFTRALEKPPVPAEAYYMAGLFFYSQGHYAYSRSLLNSYLDHKNADGERKDRAKEIILKMGEILEEQDQYRKAFQYMDEDKNEEGIALIREFLETSPLSWNGWFLLGWGLRKEQKWQEALESFEKAKEIREDEPDLLNEMAICYMEMRDLEQSRTCLLKALERNSEDIRILSNLGIVEMKSGEKDKASKWFLKVLELAPQDPLALGYLEYLDSGK